MPDATLLDDLVVATLAVSGKAEPWRDVFGLAYRLGLDPRARRCDGATLNGSSIDYDRDADPGEQQRIIAGAVARWALLQWAMLAPQLVVDAVASRLVILVPAAIGERHAAALQG